MKKSSLNNLEYLDISQEVNALQVPNTPFLSYLLGAGKVEAAKSTEIKWREYGMNNDDSSAQLEGGEYADAESDRTWFNNYTEIFRKSTSVSGTLDAINVDGVGNELNSQVALRATEDIDALFKTMFQKGYMGEKLCLVAPDMQELMTDQLDEKSTKIVQFGDKLTFGLQLGNIVSNYGSGIALIEPNLPNGTIAAIDTNYVKLRPLREWRAEELAKTTDSRRIGLVGEYSIEYKASNSGAILNLKA